MCSKPACIALLHLMCWRTLCRSLKLRTRVLVAWWETPHSSMREVRGLHWRTFIIGTPCRAPEQCAAIRGRLCCVGCIL